MQIPYITAGSGGHTSAQKLTNAPLRTPYALPCEGDPVVLESYDQTDNGYLRVVVTKTQLRIEYHPSNDGDMSKTPDDQVTIDLASRKFAYFEG